jgi:hypothetical protein
MDTIFNLDDHDIQLIKSKKTEKNKLVFAILLKYFQIEGRYPKNKKVISPDLINSLAVQINVNSLCIEEFDWQGRSVERFRQEIRDYFGFREANLGDLESLKTWLTREILPDAPTIRQCTEHSYCYLRNNKIEPFTTKELERHIRSAYRAYEQEIFFNVYNQLSVNTMSSIDKLLIEEPVADEENENESDSEVMFRHFKKDIPGAKLKYIEFEIKKLNRLKEIKISGKIFFSLPRKLLKKYYDRILAEPTSDVFTS